MLNCPFLHQLYTIRYIYTDVQSIYLSITYIHTYIYIYIHIYIDIDINVDIY